MVSETAIGIFCLCGIIFAVAWLIRGYLRFARTVDEYEKGGIKQSLVLVFLTTIPAGVAVLGVTSIVLCLFAGYRVYPSTVVVTVIAVVLTVFLVRRMWYQSQREVYEEAQGILKDIKNRRE